MRRTPRRGEDGHVALVHLPGGVAEVVEPDGAVDAGQPAIGGVHGVFDVVERPLDLATECDELTEALGRDRQIQLPGGQRRVRDPP